MKCKVNVRHPNWGRSRHFLIRKTTAGVVENGEFVRRVVPAKECLHNRVQLVLGVGGWDRGDLRGVVEGLPENRIKAPCRFLDVVAVFLPIEQQDIDFCVRWRPPIPACADRLLKPPADVRHGLQRCAVACGGNAAAGDVCPAARTVAISGGRIRALHSAAIVGYSAIGPAVAVVGRWRDGG